MTFYKDLSKCDYFGSWTEVLLAVGWLEPGEDYAKGPVSEEVLSRLGELLENPVQVTMNWSIVERHLCRFCLQNGVRTPAIADFENRAIALGRRNLFVASEHKWVYVCPSTLLHYIVKHNYCPPEDFQRAVLACPNMGSRPTTER